MIQHRDRAPDRDAERGRPGNVAPRLSNMIEFPLNRTSGWGFNSAKTGRMVAGIPPLDIDLACMLEAEPCITTYDMVDEGLFEASVLGDPVLLAVMPTYGERNDAAVAAVADRTGLSVISVPERVLRARPYIDNARLVARAGETPPSAFVRVAILNALDAEGGSAPLGDLCALASRSADPVAAVLSLVTAGIVTVDMARPIDADSEIVRVGNPDIGPDEEGSRSPTLLDLLAGRAA